MGSPGEVGSSHHLKNNKTFKGFKREKKCAMWQFGLSPKKNQGCFQELFTSTFQVPPSASPQTELLAGKTGNSQNTTNPNQDWNFYSGRTLNSKTHPNKFFELFLVRFQFSYPLSITNKNFHFEKKHPSQYFHQNWSSACKKTLWANLNFFFETSFVSRTKKQKN